MDEVTQGTFIPPKTVWVCRKYRLIFLSLSVLLNSESLKKMLKKIIKNDLGTFLYTSKWNLLNHLWCLKFEERLPIPIEFRKDIEILIIITSFIQVLGSFLAIYAVNRIWSLNSVFVG